MKEQQSVPALVWFSPKARPEASAATVTTETKKQTVWLGFALPRSCLKKDTTGIDTSKLPKEGIPYLISSDCKKFFVHMGTFLDKSTSIKPSEAAYLLIQLKVPHPTSLDSSVKLTSKPIATFIEQLNYDSRRIGHISIDTPIVQHVVFETINQQKLTLDIKTEASSSTSDTENEFFFYSIQCSCFELSQQYHLPLSLLSELQKHDANTQPSSKVGRRSRHGRGQSLLPQQLREVMAQSPSQQQHRDNTTSPSHGAPADRHSKREFPQTLSAAREHPAPEEESPRGILSIFEVPPNKTQFYLILMVSVLFIALIATKVYLDVTESHSPSPPSP